MTARAGCRAFALLVLSLTMGAHAEEWPHPGGDKGGQSYSRLEQINRGNVHRLEVAWTFDTGDWSDGTEFPARSAFEATPLVIDGTLYVPSPFSRLFALDAETGEQRWVFDPQVARDIRRSLHVNRGIASWSNGKSLRLFLGDLQGRLWAIDASSGRPISDFGLEGRIDMKAGMGFPDSHYGLTSPVAVCGDVLIAGSLVADGAPRGPSGDVRGLDARTGEVLWRFHTVPRPGEFGQETWEGDSWKDRGGTNAWSFMSVDEERQLVFVPLTSPSYDYFGGDRKGANLFGNSLLALDCRTGKRQWHFQTVHHDIWDYDLPAQPILATLQRDGRDVPAVIQITKMGFVFVFHRETGEPLFPVEERPVPASTLEGEQTHPTQPFPVKPPSLARNSMTRDELTDVTPESRAECLAITEGMKVDVRIYEPRGEQGQVFFPGTNGGPNWGGGSFDPETGLLFVNTMDAGAFHRMVRRRPGATLPFASRAVKHARFWDKNGYPCQKPPWGHLTAVDLNSGEFQWREILGEFDALTRRGVPKTGTPNIGGSIVTAGGLVFIGATLDHRFRAFDKDTGKELWTAELPASGFATPATYLGKKTGKQFVVIPAGGGNKYDKTFTGKVVAFALPDGIGSE